MSKTIDQKILKEYSIIRELGSGAYGYVWEVKCKKTQKKYAVKKIFDAFRNQVDAQRTYREIQFLSRIQNQYIIQMERIITSKNNKDVFIVFQYMQADLQIASQQIFVLQSLNVFQKNHLVFVFYQILVGLDYLHSQNLIHRDMKPSNVLVDEQSKIKICDFGLIRTCKKQQNQQQILTQEVATKWYRAPQVLIGSKKYSSKIDIWSFGCIVVELLTKKVAFPGNTTLGQLQLMMQFNGPLSIADYQSLKLQHNENILKMNEQISQKPIQQYFSQVDKQFYPLIKSALQMNPNKRLSAKQLLKLPLFSQLRKKQILQTPQQSLFLFQLNDDKMFQVSQYRQKISSIATEFNYKKQESSKKLQQLRSALQQKNKVSIKPLKTIERSQQKGNSKSLDQKQKQEANRSAQKRNISIQTIIPQKKFVVIPKIIGIQKQELGQQKSNNKILQPIKSGSFISFKQAAINRSIPYLKNQMLVKEPIKNIGIPFKPVQNKMQNLIKKSYHNYFSNQSKLFFKDGKEKISIHYDSIYRNNAITKHEQQKQLYLYSNWITQTIYGKQNKNKKL